MPLYMQICMKLASESKRALVDEIRDQMSARQLSASDLATIAGVNQGQVSRILAQDFRAVSQNVLQICIKLGIDPLRFVGRVHGDEDAKKRIVDSALSVWDGTAEDADLLVAVLGGMAALRGAKRR
ncbi:helix-turn-helix transcriptional regulator [Bradyrhizobium sp. 23]|uniref:helix-turn-helix domain-containing protein n=1 Tax=Bradyrhizobium sp. 23 TaxID=2782667 RepID=UPI001FFA7957|nr:helix-turn-helix transcriptional regulator [Bradyrhizobium sp. 23]MCK1316814.1 helix-turn-helix transcriptional regulator [Bradyrhizobium sp. 23]